MPIDTIRHIDAAFRDARGEIFNLFEGPLGHVALITSKKGSVRANHYHKQDHQTIYLIRGGYESWSCDVAHPEKNKCFASSPATLWTHRL